MHPTIGVLLLIGWTFKMGGTPVKYRIPPSSMGDQGKGSFAKLPGFSGEQVAECAVNWTIS